MKAPLLRALCAALLLLAAARAASAAPVGFDEVAMLVRIQETEPFILEQISSRRLLRPLTPAQESSLQAQGASSRLLAVLRDEKMQLSEAEAVAYEAQKEKQRLALEKSAAAEEAARLAAAAEAQAQRALAGATAPAPVPAPVVAAPLPAVPDYYPAYPGVYSGTRSGDRGVPRAFESRSPLRPRNDAPVRAVPPAPIFQPAPIGTGDRSVLPLSGNAVFVPNR